MDPPTHEDHEDHEDYEDFILDFGSFVDVVIFVLRSFVIFVM